jgi:hypothetical protein
MVIVRQRGRGWAGRSTRVALAAVLAAGAVVGTADGASASPAKTSQTLLQDLGAALFRFPMFAAVPDSAEVSAPVLAHGRLRDTAGAPMAWAQILVSAWPSNSTVHQLPTGARISLTPVARAITGAHGDYEIRAGLTPLLRSLTDRDGLDIEMDVFHAGR